MSAGTGEAGWRKDALPRVLSEIAQALESTAGAPGRVRHALERVRGLVPFDSGALVRHRPGQEPELWYVPETEEANRPGVEAGLGELLRVVVEGSEPPPRAPGEPREARLALPLVGRDEVMGLLVVQRTPPGRFDDEDLLLLQPVAAMLAAFLTVLWLQEREARAYQELALALEGQKRLMAIVSHDLRNPLAAITTGTAVLLRRQLDDRQRATAQRVLKAADRASRIIDDLIDLSLGQLGARLPIVPRRTELVALLKATCEELRLAHPGRDLRLETGEAPVWGSWDPDRLAQALTNLVGNAFQYGAADAPVIVRLGSSADRALLEVQNFGQPIPPEQQADLFDPLKRGAKSRKTAARGLGLGLYIAHGVVAAHGGEISVSSSEAEGTTFTISLPYSAAEAEAHPPP